MFIVADAIAAALPIALFLPSILATCPNVFFIASSFASSNSPTLALSSAANLSFIAFNALAFAASSTTVSSLNFLA